MQPPVQLASYLMVAERVQSGSLKLGKAAPFANGDARAESSLLLKACRTSLRAENSPPDWPVQSLGDNALRACDHCAREIFNRCVRLDRPLMRSADAQVGAPWNPQWAENPARLEARRPGGQGDFCFACVAGEFVSSEAGGGAMVLEHAPHAELSDLLAEAERQLSGGKTDEEADDEQPCALAEKAGRALLAVGVSLRSFKVDPDLDPNTTASRAVETEVVSPGGRRQGKGGSKGAVHPIRLRGGAACSNDGEVKAQDKDTCRSQYRADEAGNEAYAGGDAHAGGGADGRVSVTGGGKRNGVMGEEGEHIKEESLQQKRASLLVSGLDAKRQRAAACDGAPSPVLRIA